MLPDPSPGSSLVPRDLGPRKPSRATGPVAWPEGNGRLSPPEVVSASPDDNAVATLEKS